MLPKISKFLINWRNFAKSGHTADVTSVIKQLQDESWRSQIYLER